MIRINDRDVTAIHINGQNVLSVYFNGSRMWPREIIPIIDDILSCYYNGYWIDEYPWTDDTPWTD